MATLLAARRYAERYPSLDARLSHRARHSIRPSHGLRRFAVSLLREMGDFLIGPFVNAEFC